LIVDSTFINQQAINNQESSNQQSFYVAEQGVGFQPVASGNFLKSVVEMYGRAK
jgi:hypothetical protein